MRDFQSWLPSLAGKLWVAYVVRKYGALGLPGSPGQLLGGGPIQSQTGGRSWSLGQYIFAAIALHYGSKLFGRFLNATEFRRGGWDLIWTKLVWTEGIARSDWAKAQFGNVGSSYRTVGYQPATGQSWLRHGGRWSAMQGLVEASPLDGLVEASPLDGPYGSSFGHLLPSSASAKTVKAGRYANTGFVSNYNAAYA